MIYEYTMRLLKQRFTIFILYCMYVFRTFLSRTFLYFLSLKIYLFKHWKISTFIKEDLLQVLVTSHLVLLSISYQLPWLERIDEIDRSN